MNDNGNASHEKRRRNTQDLVNSKYYDAIMNGPVDMARRQRATESFRYYCETYGKDRFTLAWSPYHLEAIEKIEEVILRGASYALTMPRGSGKSTLCQAASEWAALCGHIQYSIYVGATAGMSTTRLTSIKTNLRFNDLLLEDFPEICGPIRFCEGEARKAGGQRFNGETTGIRWGSDKLFLPTLSDFEEVASWYKDVPFNFGSILDFASIDGNIRGRSVELPSGIIVRPQVAIVDDPQTRESAGNPAQVDKREAILKGDIGYLGGPDRRCGVMVPCTVVYEDDLADRLMDHEKNPEFRGTRSAMLEHMPGYGLSEEESEDVMRMWEVEYDEKRRYDLLNGTDFATEYYKENQEKMDRGAHASWPDRHEKHHHSAVESAMCLYLSDEMSFFCEGQNMPRPLIQHDQVPLCADDILDREIQLKQFEIPEDADSITAFVDVSRNVLWWTVIAWKKDGLKGHLVANGVFPEQPKSYVTLSGCKKTIPLKYEGDEYSSALLKALDELVVYLDDECEYVTEAGERMFISKIGIDSGWGAEAQTVYQFCRRHHKKAKIVATKGWGSSPLKRPLVDPEKKREKRSNLLGQWKFTRNTVGSQLLQYDTNLWKSRVNALLRVDKNSSSGFTIFGGKVRGRRVDHRMFADQCVAEKPAWLEGNNDRRIEVWTCPPGRDNHFFDCVIGCAVLAHTLGAKLPFTLNEVANQSNMNKQAKAKKRRRKRTRASF